MATKLMTANQTAALLAHTVNPPYRPTPNHQQPQILNPSESILSNLQSALASAAIQLADRGRQSGSAFTLRDMDTLAKVVTAAAKLAGELRENAKTTSLALHSDADVLTLVLDSVRALGDRGTAILLAALKQLAAEHGEPESELP